MKLKLLSAVLIFTMLFSGIQAFAAENFEENNTEANYAITTLTDEELKKCELSGVYKKDWAQRLQWFESKIIDRYKSFNAKNILVVGEQKFLDAFKVAVEQHDWQANFIYATSANTINNNEGGYDLVVDALYAPRHLQKIYGDLKADSFLESYQRILINSAFKFFEDNDIKYYFFEVPKLDKAKNIDDFEKKLVQKQIQWFDLKKDPDMLDKFVHGIDYSCKWMPSYKNGKYRVCADLDGDTVKVINGVRYTTDVPEVYKNNIYMV